MTVAGVLLILALASAVCGVLQVNWGGKTLNWVALSLAFGFASLAADRWLQ